MIPGRYDIDLYDGDSYLGPEIVLPDLSPFGGPSSLAPSEAFVGAEIRAHPGSSEAVPFAVEILAGDPGEPRRTLRLTLAPSAVGEVPDRGVWDLQVTGPGFVGTVLHGTVKKRPQVTR